MQLQEKKTKLKKMVSKYFSASELKCRCRRKECDALPFDKNFLEILDKIREEYAKPLIVTSASRCGFWNDRVNGSPKSQHLLSKAIDLLVENNDIKRFLEICKNNGIKGIGIGNGWLHIDIREGPNATWFY